jgi:membrane protein
MIIEWLFVSGQVYVTRYNAIYGSFAFLPLLLIWMQLVWLITLSGAVYCYSSQNIFEFSFSNQTETISDDYRWRITLAIITVTVSRFLKEEKPLDDHEIAEKYGLPISIVTASINSLLEAGLLMRVMKNSKDESLAVAPAVDPTALTIGEVLRRTAGKGSKGFIPNFDKQFLTLNKAVNTLESLTLEQADAVRIASLTINDLDITPNN